MLNLELVYLLKKRNVFLSERNYALIDMLSSRYVILDVVQMLSRISKRGKNVDFLMSEVDFCGEIEVKVASFLVFEAFEDSGSPLELVFSFNLVLDALEMEALFVSLEICFAINFLSNTALLFKDLDRIRLLTVYFFTESYQRDHFFELPISEATRYFGGNPTKRSSFWHSNKRFNTFKLFIRVLLTFTLKGSNN